MKSNSAVLSFNEMAAMVSPGSTTTGGKHMEVPLMGQLCLINYESVKLFLVQRIICPLTQVRYKVSVTIMSMFSAQQISLTKLEVSSFFRRARSVMLSPL